MSRRVRVDGRILVGFALPPDRLSSSNTVQTVTARFERGQLRRFATVRGYYFLSMELRRFGSMVDGAMLAVCVSLSIYEDAASSVRLESPQLLVLVVPS